METPLLRGMRLVREKGVDAGIFGILEEYRKERLRYDF
jgi:hypothetical protein